MNLFASTTSTRCLFLAAICVTSAVGIGVAQQTGQPEKPSPVPIAPDASLVPNKPDRVGTILPFPAGTKIEASFKTPKNEGPDRLFDNDLATWMTPGPGTMMNADKPSSIILRFDTPVTNLAGVETGESDRFKNYYPLELEFWADSDNDGRCDTRLGTAASLKPGKDAVARHMFASRLEKTYALEIRCVRQQTGGGKRVYPMNEMRLVQSDQLPLAQATPDSDRQLFYAEPLPTGTTASASFETEPGKGLENLLDNDPATFVNGKQASAKQGVPSSLFLRLPKPVSRLGGIRLGRSDPFGNYVWQQMQVWVDTTGNGTYDLQVADFAGPGPGERRFSKTAETVHGIELRVTKQKLGGTMRAFALSGVEGLVFADDTTEQTQLVVEDFEDFASWRTWANNTNQPEGERPYGGYTFLSGARRPELARSGQGVGIMRYTFKPGKDQYSMWATRGRVAEQEGIIDQIRFHADPKGYACKISFELLDATGKKMRLPGIQLDRAGWSEYVVDVKGAEQVRTAKYPLTLKYIFLTSDRAGDGDILLDDITLVGTFDRTRRVSIAPVYQGLAYAVDKPLTPTYRVRNGQASELKTDLVASLYSSFDPQRLSPVRTVSVPLSVPAHGHAEVSVDFGPVPTGHYETELSIDAPGVVTRCVDLLAVTTLNGKRINRTAMYFGSQHPADWIAAPENEFVFQNVVIPLGLDCYRTGAPEKLLLQSDLLFAAGFGGMPKELRNPKRPNDERGEPTDYDAYAAWVKQEATKKYLPYADRILAVEYYNEPDLPDFCFLPDIDVYLKMHRTWAKAFREVIPGVKLGTGGNTVQHGKEKPDFNVRMYTELAKEADVAVWHAHGPLDNYTVRHRLVQRWTEQGGRPAADQLLANTEAGLPSGTSAAGRLAQAETLVKKVGWAKSQPGSYFYCWFTTTDTYDPQGGYLANQNWGLVTYNQRLKASGQAYNELIRKLANTVGRGEVELDSRLQICAYDREDGSKVYLGWPRERGATFLVRFDSKAPVTLTDLFGGARVLEPAQGKIAFSTNGYPFYLELPAGAALAAPSKPDFVTFADVVGVPPGSEVRLPITLKNTGNADTTYELALLDPDGKPLAEITLPVTRGESGVASLSYRMPADRRYGTIGCSVRVRSSADASIQEVLPLTLVVAEKVVKADAFTIDGTPDAPTGATAIQLAGAADVQDLVSDPGTPDWSGQEDLSVTTTVSHDAKGLYFCIEVRDQTHIPGEANEKLWAHDSVQLAVHSAGAHTEIGLSEAGGGFGWQYLSPDTSRVGKKLDSPLAVKREGNRTIYETYLSFELLGIKYAPNLPVRMTFLVNEDDGRGRVRLMKWFDGIATNKSSDRFGHLVLE